MTGEVVSLLPKLRAVAQSICGGRVEDADDLVERTLHEAVHRVSDRTQYESLEAWLTDLIVEQARNDR